MAKTILLIDDNPADRKLAERMLLSSFKGWRLVPIGDALTFQETLAERLPEAVICEASVHWARGTELVQKLKSLDRFLPIIIFFSPLYAGQEEELLDLEPADLLVKSSLTYLSLSQRVLSAIRRSELMRAQLRPVLGGISAGSLDDFQVGWFQMDGAGERLRVNNTLAEWLGKPTKEVSISDLRSLLPSSDDLPALLKEAPKEQSGRQVEVEWLGKRRTVWLQQVVRREDQKIIVEGLVHDLGDLEELQQRLQRSNEDLRKFASVAAHQLKEPLRMVERFTEILMEEFAPQLDAQASEYLRFASDGASRMSKLVDDLLRFSRVDSGTPDFKKVQPGALVRMAISNLHLVLEETQAQIDFQDLFPAYGEAGQLVQVFQNLLENALKFRHPDRRPRVLITSRQRGNMVQFSVKDNGLGIPPEHLQSIFNTFKRLHSNLAGSGMGLAISRRIVERHGGRIWAESKLGEGAIFHFTLPCQPGGVG